MDNKYMEQVICDWCDAKYEKSEGTRILGDNICPDCVFIVDQEPDF
jgi:hypothetical protein